MVHVLEMSAYAVFLTYFALYATQIMQWDAFSASLAFTIAGISTLAAAPFVGLLSDRLGDRLLLCMLGMFLIGIRIAIAGRWKGATRFWPMVAESWAVVVIPTLGIFGDTAAHVVACLHLVVGYAVLGVLVSRKRD